MQWIRRSFFEIFASLLLLTLLGAAFTTSTHLAFGQPHKLKSWFSQSGIYDQVITNAITTAQSKTNSGADSTAISLQDPAVQQVARSVFSPQLVQTNFETFIDSNYAWLQGKTTAPNFSINLSDKKQVFAEQVGQSVKTYLSGLKTCTPEQLAQLQTSGTINPLAVACRPVMLDPQTEATQVTQQLESGPFIDHPLITAQTVGSNYVSQNVKPYYLTYANAPRLYQIAQKLPYVLAFAAVVLMSGLFLLAASKRTALRRIGFVFLLSGLILIAIKFIADTIVNTVEHHVFTNQNASQLQVPITRIVTAIERSLVHTDLIIGIVYVVIAVAIVIGLVAKRGRPGSRLHKTAPVAPALATTEQPARAVASPSVSQRPRPTMDIMKPVQKSTTRPTVPRNPAAASVKTEQPRRRGRLIQ